MRDKQGSRCKIQWGHHTVFPESLSLLKAPMSDDLDDFLDLLTYTCPITWITGQQRCAVSAATMGSNVACENNVKYLGFSFLKIVLALQPQPIHLLVLPSLICPCSQLLFWCHFVAKTTCGQVRVLMGFSKQYFRSSIGKKKHHRGI